MAQKPTDEAAFGVAMPGRTSIPSGDNSVWTDVSPLLQAACQDLQEGELIHGDNFNLFAAMSALEIMDPRMDSGIVCRYYSLEEAIENGAAPVPVSVDKTNDIRCTIDIMDHLLACEATWHKGLSLAQTVYSCLYLLQPDRTSSHALLHSYCRVMRATCKAVLSVVSDARTHEEEDLFTMAYGLPLSVDGDEKCLSMLNAVEETISRQLRACKTSSKRRVLEDIEPLQSNPDLEEGYCKALLCRLRFRKIFIQQFELLRKAFLPDHISYRSFKESTMHANFSSLVMCDYFKEAQKVAKDAKSCFANDPDKMSALRRLEQVAEHNSVALNLICGLGAVDPSLKVSFEFSHHPFFATAMVKRS